MSLTTSDIATCPSHSLANTCKNGHIVLTGCFENLKALNTSSSLESGAAVIIVLETFDKLDGLQIVGPDVERTLTFDCAEHSNTIAGPFIPTHDTTAHSASAILDPHP